jgi:hypothetical protein
MSAESARVIDFPVTHHVADPATGEVLPAADVQARLGALYDEVAALTRALASAHRLNSTLRTQLDHAKERRAEEACDDADLVRDLVRFHYRQFGRKKKTVPLSGLDAQIVIWLLNRVEMTARDVALMSVGFAANEFYREKGMVALMNCCTTKVDGKRIKDEEKSFRFCMAGKKLRGET